MEWTRAKKYTIIILLILNVVLLGLNIYKGVGSRLSGSRISDIKNWLENEGINVTCSLPKSYKPVDELVTIAYNYDYIRLQKIFMGNDDNVRRTDESNSVVFLSDKSRLAIKGGGINFTTVSDNEITSNNDARAFCNKIVDGINENFGNYKFHSMSKNDEGFILKYYGEAEGKNVFSNFAYFTIKGKNIGLSLNYVEIGEPRERVSIYASDEALFVAASKIKEDNEGERLINVSTVEQGYYVIGSSSGGEDYAVPFYLIVANGKEYYVNGYTGECF